MTKYSIANKKRWAKISPQERFRIMSEKGKQSAAKRTPEQMRYQIDIMVKARKRKLKLKKANA